MRTDDFDYTLPKELIAQKPVELRDASRLLVLDRNTGDVSHRRFSEITTFLSPSDLLVLNDTRVFPARLYGKKPTGGSVECFLLEMKEEEKGPAFNTQVWSCLLRGRRVGREAELTFSDSLKGRISRVAREKVQSITLFSDRSIEEEIDRIGVVPLPPYIKRPRGEADDPLDRVRYQTVYGRRRGAVAAPTAGLHFTEEILENLREKDIEILYLTLHVGWGSFEPVKKERLEEHEMHREYFILPPETAEGINRARTAGKKIVAVGTTTTRCLEWMAEEDGTLREGAGWVDLFIYPGYRFKVIDKLLTNFHLPRSTLIMLVSAFATRELIMKAYGEAMERKYRFYSYGDAMFIK